MAPLQPATLILSALGKLKVNINLRCNANAKIPIFRLDALISVERNSYSDVAGWLGGWLSVTAGIVSKRLNVSENFFDHLHDSPIIEAFGTPYADTKFQG